MGVKENNHWCDCSACAERYAALQELHNWLVCYAIVSAEDMAQSFPRMLEIVQKATGDPWEPT